MPPAFEEDGTVTAGNASQLSDGASMTLLMSAERANQLGIKPMGVYRGFTVAACEPDEMGIGPVFAIPRLLENSGLRKDDVDLWELNEAFASQCVYCRNELDLDNEKYNVNGGSISIGHPFGMTGSRCTGTILRELETSQQALRRGDHVHRRRSRSSWPVRARLARHLAHEAGPLMHNDGRPRNILIRGGNLRETA